jgi:hypothetical protein
VGNWVVEREQDRASERARERETREEGNALHNLSKRPLSKQAEWEV